ncbi:MAG: dephospho-CoA kinase [Paludibacteraceae bacterium]|nr:dephospho-CoA kinase [Paludibacteraceae bacterium]
MLFGITGGIGSGKSTIAHHIASLGYPVYDCDSQAKRIILTDPHVREQIIALLGPEAYDGDRYCTDYVASRVFGSDDSHSLLRALNAIVHPAVKADLLRWYQALSPSGTNDAFVESAILFSGSLADVCDAVIIVTAPIQTRVARTMARDNATQESVMARILTQDQRETPLQLDADPTRTIHICNDGKQKIADLVQNMFYNIRTKLA